MLFPARYGEIGSKKEAALNWGSLFLDYIFTDLPGDIILDLQLRAVFLPHGIPGIEPKIIFTLVIIVIKLESEPELRSVYPADVREGATVQHS